MKRVLFILSHHCSGSDQLYNALDQNPKIQGFRSGNVYENRQSLVQLTDRNHKLDNASAIYMDELLENFQIEQKIIYQEPRLIFFIKQPGLALKEMVLDHKVDLNAARKYYSFRLGRLEHIARRAKNGVLLTYEDFRSGLGGDLIENYLRLKDPLMLKEQPENEYEFGYSPIQIGSDVIGLHDRFLRAIKSYGIKSTS
jgi:hypothetical protein